MTYGQKIMLDVRIWETELIVGILGRKRLRFSDGCTEPFAVQVSLTVDRHTCTPLFTPLPENYTSKFLIENVLRSVRTLASTLPAAKLLEFGKIFPDQFPEAKRLSSPG